MGPSQPRPCVNLSFSVCPEISPSGKIPSLSAYYSRLNELGAFQFEFIINRATHSQHDTQWREGPLATREPKQGFLGMASAFPHPHIVQWRQNAQEMQLA